MKQDMVIFKKVMFFCIPTVKKKDQFYSCGKQLQTDKTLGASE